MPVRNEDWIVGLGARAALRWVDHLVLLDHASTDRTEAVLESVCAEFPNRVTVLNELDPEWQEMRHRQRMLTVARQLDATHIAMVDADEVLSGNLLNSIRGYIERIPEHATMQLPWQCLRGGIDRVMVSGIWGEATVCMAFPDGPEWHWAAREGYDFHHRNPMGRPFVPFQPITRVGGIMHLQFTSARRLAAKQALYKMTEVLRWPTRDSRATINARYNYAIYDSRAATVSAVDASWWEPYSDLMGHLDLSEDNSPWQETEVRRLYAQHGPSPFVGLDLFGVAEACQC